MLQQAATSLQTQQRQLHQQSLNLSNLNNSYMQQPLAMQTFATFDNLMTPSSRAAAKEMIIPPNISPPRQRTQHAYHLPQ